MITTALISISIIMFAVWNGLKINSKYWHTIAFIVKLPLVAVAYIESGLIAALVVTFICWIPYNIVIALMMGQKWYYVGKTAWTDKLIRKLLPFINFDR